MKINTEVLKIKCFKIVSLSFPGTTRRDLKVTHNWPSCVLNLVHRSNFHINPRSNFVASPNIFVSLCHLYPFLFDYKWLNDFTQAQLL